VPQDQSGSVKGDPLFDEIAALSQELETVARKIGQAETDRQAETELEPSEPLTITVRAEEAEVAPAGSQEKPADQTAPAPETPAPKAGQPAAKTATDEEKTATAPSAPAAAQASEPPARHEQQPAASTSESTESGKPAGTKQAHADQPAPPQAATAQAQEDKHAKAKTHPDIFIPTRPPDDPGPEPTDYEEASTPYSRYRNH